MLKVTNDELGILFAKLAELFSCEISTLHFLKESKYFSLSLSLSLSYTTKPQKSHGKDWKKDQNWGFQFVTLPWNNLQTCRFYAQSGCKIYVLLESKWRQCHYGICTLLYQVSIDIFDVFGHIWNLKSHTENLKCDISSLGNDTEMVDHSMNHKFEGTTYD